MSNNILLPATADCIFKALMLNLKLVDVLKELISHITGLPMEALEGIEVKNTEYTIDNKNDKKMRSDVLVSIGKKYINIEMNGSYYAGVLSKNDAYLSKIKATTYNSGESYYNAVQVIQINFNDFQHFKIKKDIYKFVFMESTTHEVDEESTIKYHVSLSNIWSRCYNNVEINKLSRFERFCMLLKTKDEEYARILAGDDEVMDRLVEEMRKLSLDEKMIGLYDAEVEAEKIRKTIIESATDEGIKKGLKQGIKQGIEQGIKQGIEQGIEQGRKEKYEMIKSLHLKGVDAKVIASSANMDVLDVEKIINTDN